MDEAEILPLLFRELGVEKQLGVTDDPVERGPDLVTHHGQEQRLGPLGPLRLLLGQADLPDGLHPFGDVTHDAVHQGSTLVLHPAPHHFHRQERSIPPPQLGLTAAVSRALNIV